MKCLQYVPIFSFNMFNLLSLLQRVCYLYDTNTIVLTEFIQLLFNDYVICNIEQKGFNSFICKSNLGETKFPGLNIEAKFQKFWGFTEVHFILEPWGFELNHQKSFGFCDQISWFLSCAKILTL